MEKVIKSTTDDVHEVLSAKMESSENKFYNCSIGMNDKHVSIKLSSPVNVSDGCEKKIEDLNRTGCLLYRLSIEQNKELAITAVLDVDKYSGNSMKAILDIITNLVAQLNSALIVVNCHIPSTSDANVSSSVSN